MSADRSRRPSSAIEIADEPDAWRAAGFTVDGDARAGRRDRVPPRRARPTGSASGRGPGTASPATVRSTASTTHAGDAADVGSGRAPERRDVLDHVVVVTPRLDRSIAAFEARGLDVRRVRHTDQYGPAFRQVFFRGGETIIEMIGPDEPPADDERPAHFYGLAFTVADLDAAADVLGDGLGRIKDAVQPGRRIATLRHEHYDISVPIAPR